MKKISLIAAASLIALSSAASAQSFDLNAMPLGQFPSLTDKTSTGSIGSPLKKRIIVRDGASVTQYFTVGENGDVTIVSEKKN